MDIYILNGKQIFPSGDMYRDANGTHNLATVDGRLSAGGVTIEQRPADPDSRFYTFSRDDAGNLSNVTAKPLADIVAARKAECDQLGVVKRDSVTSGISNAEMASWAIKRSEAVTYQTTTNPLDAPLLADEAIARGITLDALVAKVLAKAVMFSTLEAGIAGTNGRHNDSLTSLATSLAAEMLDNTKTAKQAADEVIAYDITTGWTV